MICCATGHSPKGFPFFRNEENSKFIAYKERLDREIVFLINEGYTHFITGMADGADLDFAENIIFHRKGKKVLHLEAALPYPPPLKIQNIKKGKILLECDSKHIVSPYYHQRCMQNRNEYMVDKADIVLAIWNGMQSGGTWNTIKYAKSIGKPIRYILLNEIE